MSWHTTISHCRSRVIASVVTAVGSRVIVSSPLSVLMLLCHCHCCHDVTSPLSVLVLSPPSVLVLSCHHCWFWCCHVTTVGSGWSPLSVLVLFHRHCRFWCCRVIATVGSGVVMSPLLVLVLPCRETTAVHTRVRPLSTTLSVCFTIKALLDGLFSACCCVKSVVSLLSARPELFFLHFSLSFSFHSSFVRSVTRIEQYTSAVLGSSREVSTT